MRNRLKKWRGRLWAALYAAFALVWLCGALLGLLANRTAAPAALVPGDAAPEGLLAGEAPGQFVSENGDPKLVFTDIARPVRYVRLTAQFTRYPAEMDLFYTTRPGQDFSVRRRVIGAPQQDGSYLYTLPPFTTVQDLRLDLGTVADNGITVTSIQLDPRLPAGHFLAPTLRTAAALAVLPALALCVIYTIIEWYRAVKKGLPARKVIR